MKTEDVIRAWKDADFRAELNEAEFALLPQNPAGLVQLTDEALEVVVGGVEDTEIVVEASSCICWSC